MIDSINVSQIKIYLLLCVHTFHCTTSFTNIEASRGKETPGLEFHYCDVKEVKWWRGKMIAWKSEFLLCNHTLYEKKPFITVIVSLSTMPSALMRMRKYTRRRRVNMVWNFANILSVWASILALRWFNDDDGNGSVHPLAHSLFCHRVCVRSIPFLHIHPRPPSNAILKSLWIYVSQFSFNHFPFSRFARFKCDLTHNLCESTNERLLSGGWKEFA